MKTKLMKKVALVTVAMALVLGGCTCTKPEQEQRDVREPEVEQPSVEQIAEEPPSLEVSVELIPSVIEVRSGQVITLRVLIDPGDNGISSSEVNILYDPNVIRLISINPGNLLGIRPLIGAKQVDDESGSVKYVLARAGNTVTPTPSGNFADIEFQVLDDAQPGQYPISFGKIGIANEKYEDLSDIKSTGCIITIHE